MKKNNTKSIPCPFVAYTGKWQVDFSFVLFILFILLPAVSFSQTLEDFRTAAGYTKGVETIPFKDLRIEATSIASEVQRYKAVVMRQKKASLFESEKDNLLEAIKKATASIKKEEDLAKKHNVPVNERQIKEPREVLALNTAKVKKMNQEIENAIDAFDRYNNARAALRDKFDEALKGLSDAAAHPAKYLGKAPTAGDKTHLTEYIKTIVRNINAEKETHLDQETGAGNTAEKLQETLNRS